MSRPVDALSAARQCSPTTELCSWPTGWSPTNSRSPPPLERIAYGWSVVSCLPGAMGDPQTAATGAVMRPRCFVSTPYKRASAR